MNAGITVRAWIDGGSSDPEVTVSLNRSEHEGMYELVVRRGEVVLLGGVLLDADGLRHLLG